MSVIRDSMVTDTLYFYHESLHKHNKNRVSYLPAITVKDPINMGYIMPV